MIRAVEKNEGGKHEVANLPRVVREGLSAKVMFAGMHQGGEGGRLTLQVWFVEVPLGSALSLLGSQQRCDAGSACRLVHTVPS